MEHETRWTGWSLSPPVKEESKWRPVWLSTVTAAEALGFTVPALLGVVLASRGLDSFFVPLVIAGAIEGALLGVGLVLAWPAPLDRSRFVGLTVLGASGAWVCGLGATSLVQSGLPRAVLLPFLSLLAVVGLGGIGVAQWFELRRHYARAHHWIGWSALAWVLALPLSFLPGPFVDESSALWVHLLVWPAAGVLMAFVMALVTSYGVRDLHWKCRGVGSRMDPGRAGLAATRYWGNHGA